MNRREFLQSISVAVVIPYNDTPPHNVGDIDYPVLTYRNRNDETGRMLERYELKPRDKLRVQWRLKDEDGHVNFVEEYPFDQLTEHYYSSSVVIRFYSAPPERAELGHTWLSTEGTYAYHQNLRGDRAHLYREHIDSGDYTRIE